MLVHSVTGGHWSIICLVTLSDANLPVCIHSGVTALVVLLATLSLDQRYRVMLVAPSTIPPTCRNKPMAPPTAPQITTHTGSLETRTTVNCEFGRILDCKEVWYRVE